MHKGRLEAFSDGVIAIIITIMVLELKAPHSPDPAALRALAPVLGSYVLSFVFVGIYWSNHHHLLQAAQCVSGGSLWANLHLLFWLSLTPFVTAWMGESHFAPWPVALYGGVLMMSGVAYYILTRSLICHLRPDSPLARAVGKDYKGILSVACYAVGIPFSFVSPWIAMSLYMTVSLMWLIPDRRIERQINGA